MLTIENLPSKLQQTCNVMEDPAKCEDTEVSETTACSQVNQTCSDTKSSVDSKNTQVRIVRGTKKIKIDNDLSNVEKKGVLT